MSNLVLQDGRWTIVGVGENVPAALRIASPFDARRAGIELWYNGSDITRDIAPWALGAEWKDCIEEADDLTVTLYNDGRWTDAWAPAFGAKIEAWLILSEMGSSQRLPLGIFTIEEVCDSDPPSIVKIKAISVDVAANARREKKSRAWQDVSLRWIAQTIAKNAKLELMWLATCDPKYARKDQVNKSDLEFLSELALREGMRIKTSDGRLIVFEQEQYDALPVVASFHPGDGHYIGRDLKCGISNSYSKATVRYWDVSAKKLLEYSYVVPNAPATGQTWRVKRRCESLAEAQRVAVNEVARMNHWGQSGNLDLIGDSRLLAASNIGLEGMGSLINGVWSIEEASHSVWPYTTKLQICKVG